MRVPIEALSVVMGILVGALWTTSPELSVAGGRMVIGGRRPAPDHSQVRFAGLQFRGQYGRLRPPLHAELCQDV